LNFFFSPLWSPLASKFVLSRTLSEAFDSSQEKKVRKERDHSRGDVFVLIVLSVDWKRLFSLGYNG
jgi:hypothetical protein